MTDDPRAFWQLEDDYPLDDHGIPVTERVGRAEIVFLAVQPAPEDYAWAEIHHEPRPTAQPDFSVHATDRYGKHGCEGHFHEHDAALTYAALLNALWGPFADTLQEILVGTWKGH